MHQPAPYSEVMPFLIRFLETNCVIPVRDQVDSALAGILPRRTWVNSRYSSARMLVYNMWMCSNATGVLGKTWGNMNLYVCLCVMSSRETWGEHKIPTLAQQSCRRIYKTHKPQTFTCQWPQFTMCYEPHHHNWCDVPSDFRWPLSYRFTTAHKPHPLWCSLS